VVDEDVLWDRWRWELGVFIGRRVLVCQFD
jgi:hypothetical protein